MNGEIYKIGIRYVYRIGISIGKVVNICERKNWNFEKLDKEGEGIEIVRKFLSWK